MEEKTLNLVDEFLEKENNESHFTDRIGCSLAGHSCDRYIYFKSRNFLDTKLKSSSLRAIDDGNRSEKVMADRLRLIPSITLETGENGRQIEVSHFEGKLIGYLDGKILGLAENPNVWHVWEHKAPNVKIFNKLKKQKEKGLKNLLFEFNPVYWTQAQLYMHLSGIKNHFTTVSSENLRNVLSIFTEYDKEYCLKELKRLEEILYFNTFIPAKIEDNPFKAPCSFCNYKKICHDYIYDDIKKHCLTCDFSIRNNFGWYCKKAEGFIPDCILETGCKHNYMQKEIDEIDI